MSKRSISITVRLTPEEAETIEAHPDHGGKLADTVRALALAAVGAKRPDPYAHLREAPRGGDGRVMAPWQALIKEAFARYHAEGRSPGHQELHWQMSAAKARARFTDLLDPVLITGTGFGPEAYQSLSKALAKDWQDVRAYALLASSAAAGKARYK